MDKESLKYKTKQGLYWKTFEQVSLHAMQFVVGIVMARLLSPGDYGITVLPAVLLSVAQVFIDGSFGLALVRKKEVTESDLATAFYYSIIVGCMCYVGVFVGAPYVAEFYNVPILTPLIRATALNFIWNPLMTPQSVILNRRLDFRTPARISIVNKIFGAAAGIIVAYLGFGVWALVVAMLTSSFMGVLQTWFAVKWLPKAKFSRASFGYLWNFGNKLMVVQLLQTVYANIAPVVIGKAGGTVDLGNLDRARSFAQIPSSYMTNLVGTVAFPVLSRIKDSPLALAENYRRMIKMTMFVSCPIMLLLCALAHPLVIFLLTAKWESSVILLQILCGAYMLLPMQMLNINLLQIVGRTDLTLRIEIIKKTVYFIAIIIAVQYGLLVFCLTDLLLNIFALVVNTYYTGKLIRLGLFKQLMDIAHSLILAFVMMISVFLATHFITGEFWRLTIGGPLGLLIYWCGARIFRFEELEDVKYLLGMKKL